MLGVVVICGMIINWPRVLCSGVFRMCCCGGLLLLYVVVVESLWLLSVLIMCVGFSWWLVCCLYGVVFDSRIVMRSIIFIAVFGCLCLKFVDVLWRRCFVRVHRVNLRSLFIY